MTDDRECLRALQEAAIRVATTTGADAVGALTLAALATLDGYAALWRWRAGAFRSWLQSAERPALALAWPSVDPLATTSLARLENLRALAGYATWLEARPMPPAFVALDPVLVAERAPVWVYLEGERAETAAIRAARLALLEAAGRALTRLARQGAPGEAAPATEGPAVIEAPDIEARASAASPASLAEAPEPLADEAGVETPLSNAEPIDTEPETPLAEPTWGDLYRAALGRTRE